MANDFTKLKIWQKAHTLTLDIYSLSKNFPPEELYALTSQVRRSAISVELNIAEGHGRYHYLEEVKFLVMARGSITETQSSLVLAKDLQYCSDEKAKRIFDEYTGLIKQINSLISYKRKEHEKG